MTEMTNIENQFEPIAHEYAIHATDPEDSRYEFTVNWPSIERMLPEPPLRIMDYGSGNGVYAALMAEKGYEVVAVDSAQSMLDQVPRGIETRLWSYQDEPLAGRVFDAVVAKLVLQFVDDLPGFAKAIHGQLPEGGLLVASIPNPAKSAKLLRQQGGRREYTDEISSSGLKVTMIHRNFNEYQRAMGNAGLQFLRADSPIDPKTPQAPPRRLNMLFRALR